MFYFLKNDHAHPFQFAKILSGFVLLLVFSSGLFLSIFISNYARKTVFENHKDFSLLLAENLNHQIYQRFILPTVIGYGRVQLKNPEQHERLAQVVEMTTHSFHILELKIYDDGGVISFSTDKAEIGTRKEDIAIQEAFEKKQKKFTVLSSVPVWRSFFSLQLKPASFVLRAVYPLQAEWRLTSGNVSGPVIGVLEFTQDITLDYEAVIHFQRLIILASFFSSFVLFLIIWYLLRRADSLLGKHLQEKSSLEQELMQNEKLASIGRIVASIAHEIRNPLGIIKSSAELLCKKSKEEDKKHRLLTAIYDESARLSQTVTDFLDYARPKSPIMQNVDIGSIFSRIERFLDMELQAHNVNMIIDLQAYTIKGDGDLLYRAFYNLIVNSLQAIERNGEIKVTSCVLKNKIEVCIEDTGSGFTEEESVYTEPFYTTKENGTGLGLAIANTIFDSHGAKMFLKNRKDGGALICVVFSILER